MAHAVSTLEQLDVSCDVRVLSAHRTPDALFAYIAEAEQRGVRVFIAGAGGAAHLPGVIASKTLCPVIGIPIESPALKGMDSLLSIVQMPAGIPVSTMAIGKAGAINAALTAAAILALDEPRIGEALRGYRAAKAERILAEPDPRAGQ
jgi:5-(carboxyamino)imidazole ribonucleotide mutase